MTVHLFISSTGKLQSHWGEAFPKAKSQAWFFNELKESSAEVFWLEWPVQLDDRHYHELNNVVALGKPVVVMSPVPDQAQAQTALSLGAKGYCHSHAASKQLREIAQVVTHGGLWLGPDLVQKVLSGSQRAAVQLASSKPVVVETLTKRESLVGEMVAKGLTNKEIADRMGIGERTVKSYLTTIFQKLGVRDRVHLALYLNDIEIDSP